MSLSFEVNPRLLVDFHHEPKQILEPINGLEQEPLVSLDEACQSLENILGTELKLYITVAKVNSQEPRNGLTQDESASIYLYTMEWNETKNSLYAVLNQTLCSPDKSKLQPWLKYLKLFFTAFFKLPFSEYHTVWRGIPEDLSGLYRESDEVTWWSLSSTTSSLEVLESPMYLGRAETRTMFSIKTKNGRLIREHSHLQNDDEILLPPGIVLKVLRSVDRSDGVHIIYLCEMESSRSRFANSFNLPQMNETSSIHQDQYRNPVLEATIQSSELRSKLSLESMNLNDRDMEIVAKLGINEKKCMILNLRDNKITSVGASILAKTFNCNNNLMSLLLDGNHISDSGVQSLAIALTTDMSHRRTLYLTSTGITDASCDYLAQMLRANHAVMYLFLGNNKIGDRGAQVLCETIRSRNCGITILGLAGNKLITDASVDAFCCTISENPFFHQLFVSNCSLSTASQERLRVTAEQRGGFLVHL